MLHRYAEQQNTRMQRDTECRAIAALEEAGVSAAAGDPHTMQQLLVGSVSHKVLTTQRAAMSPGGQHDPNARCTWLSSHGV